MPSALDSLSSERPWLCVLLLQCFPQDYCLARQVFAVVRVWSDELRACLSKREWPHPSLNQDMFKSFSEFFSGHLLG